MSYLGDFFSGCIIRHAFTTRRFSTGATFTLGGTPALLVRRDIGAQDHSCVGVQLAVDCMGRTGLNTLEVRTNSDQSFYSCGHDFTVEIDAGTVDSVSVVGEVIAAFSLGNRSNLRPVIHGRNKIEVDSAFRITPNPTCTVNVLFRSGATAGGATSITLGNEASSTENTYTGSLIALTEGTGAGQSNLIISYAGSTRVATVARTWATNPAAGTCYSIIAFGPDVSCVPTNFTSMAISTTGCVSVGTIGTNAITSAAIQLGAITSDALAANTITAAKIAKNAITNDQLATSAANQIADCLLNRNVSGGSSTGRVVKEALHRLRNKVTLSGGVMQVFDTNDSTCTWAATVATTAGNPVSSVDPGYEP